MRKLEPNIKAAKSFLEVWTKFHSIYSGIIQKEIISKEDEERFMESLYMIRNKYEDLKGGLDYKYMPHARLTDPVSDILSLNGIRFMSEKNLKRLNDNWRDSYVFLNNILEQLKGTKKRMDELNPVGAFFKKVFFGS